MRTRLVALGIVLAAALPAGSKAQDLPGFEDLTATQPARTASSTSGSSRIVTRGDGRYYSYDGVQTFGDIARQAYGDEGMWYLIYRQNRDRIAASGGGAMLLKLPEPPEKRVTRQGNVRHVQVLPGDTFSTLSKRLYGTADYWKALYLANRDKLEDPENPFQIFGTSTTPKTFLVPDFVEASALVRTSAFEFGTHAPSGTPRSPTSMADTRTKQLGLQAFSEPGAGGAGAGPDAYKHTSNPIASLELRDASQIGEAEAATILRGTGMLRKNEPLSKGLARLGQGYSYRRRPGQLDQTAKQRLFREYTLLKAALNRWAAYPNIGNHSTPQLVDTWIKAAAKNLTAVPESKRYSLIKSLMLQESSISQWRNFIPVAGTSGDTGFGQFLPSTAKMIGINPYDPEQNVRGIGLFLNSLVRRTGGNVREALAEYNGGGHPPASSYRYADSILRRVTSLA